MGRERDLLCDCYCDLELTFAVKTGIKELDKGRGMEVDTHSRASLSKGNGKRTCVWRGYREERNDCYL